MGLKEKEIDIPEMSRKEVDAVYEEILEVLAESDDELMEKYAFGGEEFTDEEFTRGFSKAILDGNAVPLVAGSATNGVGVSVLLEIIEKYMPSPNHAAANIGFRVKDEYESFAMSKDAPFSAMKYLSQ